MNRGCGCSWFELIFVTGFSQKVVTIFQPVRWGRSPRWPISRQVDLLKEMASAETKEERSDARRVSRRKRNACKPARVWNELLPDCGAPRVVRRSSPNGRNGNSGWRWPQCTTGQGCPSACI